MKLTYIITAHNYPQMLERLIERLKGDEISFIVHIDAKSKKDFLLIDYIKSALIC